MGSQSGSSFPKLSVESDDGSEESRDDQSYSIIGDKLGIAKIHQADSVTHVFLPTAAQRTPRRCRETAA